MSADVSLEIAAMEKRLKEHEVTIGEFCDDCGINRSTWTRWKRGKNSPNMGVWKQVLSVYQLITQGKNT